MLTCCPQSDEWTNTILSPMNDCPLTFIYSSTVFSNLLLYKKVLDSYSEFFFFNYGFVNDNHTLDLSFCLYSYVHTIGTTSSLKHKDYCCKWTSHDPPYQTFIAGRTFFFLKYSYLDNKCLSANSVKGMKS